VTAGKYVSYRYVIPDWQSNKPRENEWKWLDACSKDAGWGFRWWWEPIPDNLSRMGNAIKSASYFWYRWVVRRHAWIQPKMGQKRFWTLKIWKNGS